MAVGRRGAGGVPAALPAVGLGRARPRRHLVHRPPPSAAARSSGPALAPGDIAAIGITNQRETTLVWDRATGEPLGPRHRLAGPPHRRALRRAARRRPRADGHRAHRPAARPLLLRHQAQVAARRTSTAPASARRGGELLFGTVDSWLIWKLTGGARPRHRRHQRRAHPALRHPRAAPGTPRSASCSTSRWRCCPRSATAPPTSARPAPTCSAAPIPILGVAGDQQAATVGQACFAPGMLKATYGTGCFALLNTGDDAGAEPRTGC